MSERGYAASREQAMADFKARWLRDRIASPYQFKAKHWAGSGSRFYTVSRASLKQCPPG
jgi:hypothetical protein